MLRISLLLFITTTSFGAGRSCSVTGALRTDNSTTRLRHRNSLLGCIQCNRHLRAIESALGEKTRLARALVAGAPQQPRAQTSQGPLAFGEQGIRCRREHRPGGGQFPGLRVRVVGSERRAGPAVVVVAEGAGEELLGASTETDASGNKKLPQIGEYMKKVINEYFKEQGEDATVK